MGTLRARANQAPSRPRVPLWTGDMTASLERVASAMHEAGLAGAWRNEQLAVAGLT
ncbi:MAG: hypothetical protein PHR71_05095 [Polaromonas sp.]|nr:hypothetical protein [Polaromonas sp.]